ncbi:MAG: HNH endonuclease family protein, partial [Kineosporiaceae bacterium]
MGSRRRGLRMTLVLLALVSATGVAAWWLTHQAPAAAPHAPPAPSVSAPAAAAPASTAVEALRSIEIGPLDPAAGYSRLLFGSGWLDPDGNGCDARNDILRRDLTGVVLRPRTNGCIVERGTLRDPYTGAEFAFERGPDTSGQVQIDHVVSLANAWRTGAQAWSVPRRVAFANDPLELLAVLKQTNADKDGADAASWLPPRPELRCSFVARQVAVKARYRLRMT